MLLVVRARAQGSLRLAGATGVALGLAILIRATLAPFVPLAAVWLALLSREATSRKPGARKGPLGNLVHALSYGPLALLALAGAWRTRRRWRELLPIYPLFAIFAPITAVLWGHSSHRSALDVYLIVLAAPVQVSLRAVRCGQ